jgi:60 kDa SS-A/Ro ribonucleoprotein
MANKDLFKAAPRTSSVQATIPTATTVNQAGGRAYALPNELALAQLAATGTFNDTYYGKGSDQLDAIKRAADGVSPLFVGQTAAWARTKGYMKDMPAALVTMLSKADSGLFHKAYLHAIDNGKQMRTLVQMVRSGVFGRKCLGSSIRRAIREHLDRMSDAAVFRASVGQNPSLRQVLKLVHPKPKTASRRALYAYIRGFEPAGEGKPLVEKDGKERTIYRYNPADLPPFVRQLDAFRKGETTVVPNVDYRFLEGLELPEAQRKALWAAIAKRGRFMQTFKNLNNYLERGLLDLPDVKAFVVAKLKDKDEVRGSRVLPYQLLAAWLHTDAKLPFEVREALQDAMEIATENVPAFADDVLVLLDVSDSMNKAPVTGHRKDASTKIMCNQAAALIASAILRRNRSARVLPFDTAVRPIMLNPRDSVLTNTQKLTIRGGGTSCSEALAYANREGLKAKLVVYLSDNESWADATPYGKGTAVMEQFRKFQARNAGAKMVCLDLQTNTTTQAVGEDVLNIGGFSDQIWKVIAEFASGRKSGAKAEEPGVESEELTALDAWISEIKAIDLDAPPPSRGPAQAAVTSEDLSKADDEDGDDVVTA